tara:strand:- start:92 stop:313 length:222 start_codon:yes stop_codon:yes gene_type:complete
MLKMGKYQHFKGNYYQVLYIAKHSENEEYMVVYQPLYDNKEGIRDIWVRPLNMFDEVIEREGIKLKRFSFIEE